MEYTQQSTNVCYVIAFLYFYEALSALKVQYCCNSFSMVRREEGSRFVLKMLFHQLLGHKMSSGKKIGLFACTGIVAGNMMGSGIALLPSNLASIGSVALFGWLIAMFGALALAYVYARLSTVRKAAVLSLMRVKSARPSGIKPACFITTPTGSATLQLQLLLFPISQSSSQFSIIPFLPALPASRLCGSSRSSTSSAAQ